jgi:hypothetical protein
MRLSSADYIILGTMEKVDYRQSFEIGEDVFYQPMQDEVVLLNLKSQQYYGLDVMGARIWNLLLEHRNVETVADRICAEYDVDRDRALRDIEVMVKDFFAAGLVKVRSDGSQHPGTRPVDKLS